ncbi:protein translocase subunit SecD [Mycobacterium sp. pUA109]|uniref:protein translocase subunit SecD n=1 Tax=Mycobacterium sp. pUA109 TaxID=3238982 RepID=UPI00351B7A0C
MESFGRYQLLDVVSRSDTGEVFRAHDTDTDRVVAVQVLSAQLSEDPEFAQRFRDDTRRTADLNDPHIVPIHNYGDIDGRLYVDMRLIEGRDLATVLAHDGRLHPARAVAIIEQLAATLDAAHHAGLTPRDLRPSTVLIDAGDFVYLNDFGTTAHPRADIPALAGVLSECLTGQHPGSGLAPDIPPGLGAVIARGMADNPTERYHTATELAYAARTALNPVPIYASTMPPPPGGQSALARAAVCVAVFAVLLVAGYLTVLVSGGRAAPKLGIDLAGGTRVTLTPRTADGSPPPRDALAQAQKVLSAREPGTMVAVDGDTLVVTVPGDDAGQLRTLAQTGQLYIRPVINAVPAQSDPNQSTSPPDRDRDLAASIAMAKRLRQSDSQLIQLLTLRMQAARCEGDDVLAGRDDPKLPLVTCSKDHKVAYLLGPSIISGDQIQDATSGMDQQSGGYAVELRFKKDAANTWADYTAAHVGTQTAFTLDTQVVSAPQIQEAIPGGRTRITGDFTRAQAKVLAGVLKYGSLPLSFDSSNAQTVPAAVSPGAARAGLVAAAVILVALLIAALMYHRVLGLIAAVSVAASGALVFAILVLVGRYLDYLLELPGLAGLGVGLVGIGASLALLVARARADIRAGAAPPTWRRARNVVLVGNAGAALVAAVLAVLPVHAVKNFAVSLGVTAVVNVLVLALVTWPLLSVVTRPPKPVAPAPVPGYPPGPIMPVSAPPVLFQQSPSDTRRTLAIIAAVIAAAVVVAAAAVAVVARDARSRTAASTNDTRATTSAAASSTAPPGNGQLPPFTAPADLGANCQYPPAVQPASKPVELPRSGRVPTDPAQVSVSMDTDQGPIGLTLDNGKAPCTVNSFISLAQQGYFDNTGCHRLTTAVSLSVLQCGDPDANGTGGPGYQFGNEYPTDQYPPGDPALQDPVVYPRGTLAMANAGPNTNGSQFFLVYRDSQLPPQYTIFGSVDQAGLGTLDKIAAGGVASGGQAPDDGPPNIKVTITSIRLV